METPILQRTTKCPRCGTKTMRLSHGYSVGREYFDDKCHEYFGIDELVNKWGYDLGDFGDKNWDIISAILRKIDNPIIVSDDKLVATTWFDTESTVVIVMDEPVWYSILEKDDAYEMVNRMFAEIPEWDLDGTTNDGIDTGLYR